MKNKKNMITAIIIGALAALVLVSRKSVRAEILIPAEDREIWKVLMDQEAYPDWNPVLIPVQGKLEEGNRLKYEFHQDNNSSTLLKARVKRTRENELLNQAGGIPGILTFNHKYILEKLGESTKIIIHETYRGVGVLFWNSKPVERAYERMAKALKDRVISLKLNP